MSKKKASNSHLSAKKLPVPLKNLFIEHFFPDAIADEEGNFTKPSKGVPESEFQILIQLIQDKLRGYLKKIPDSPESFHIITLLKTRLNEKELELFKNGTYTKELVSSKTLKRCYVDEGGTKKTHAILEAYHIVLKKEQEKQQFFNEQIARIAGLYYVYATHESKGSTFQESILQIKPDGTIKCTYENSSRNKVTKTFVVELIGSTGLLLTHIEENYALIFFIYMGEVDKPHFIQAVHMYSNRDNNTVANLAVFQRAMKDKEEQGRNKVIEYTLEEQNNIFNEFKPTRERKRIGNYPGLEKNVKMQSGITIKENIYRFLSNRVTTLSTLLDNGSPFDFGVLPIFPGADLAQEYRYSLQQKFVGIYHLYFNERFPSIRRGEASARDDFFSSVGDAVLIIKTDDITGQLICSMEMNRNIKNEERLIYEGKVINEKLSDTSTLILSLYLEPTYHQYLHLLFNIVDENKLIGCFNITYTVPLKLGAGVVMAVRRKEEIITLAEDVKPKAMIASHYSSEDKTQGRMLNFLSRNRLSIVTPPDFSSLENYSHSLYWGIYRMYFKETNQKDKLIIKTLVIYCNSRVELREPQKGVVAYGECEAIHDMLNITLRQNNPERTSYACVRVKNRPPRQEDKTTYQGSLAGYSLSNDRVPMTSLFLLEFIEAGRTSSRNWNNLHQELEEEEQNQIEVPPDVKYFFNNTVTYMQFERPMFK